MIVDRDIPILHKFRGHDPVNFDAAIAPILLFGGMGVGKSEILKRFHAEQPHILFATVRTNISEVADTVSNGINLSVDAIFDDIGEQFGLPRRNFLGSFDFDFLQHVRELQFESLSIQRFLAQVACSAAFRSVRSRLM